MPEPHSTTTGPTIPTAISDAGPGLLKPIAVRGAIWTMAGFSASQVLRFGFNLILTRLLFPEMFGLMALVYTIVNGLSLFCDLGTGPAIVRDPRGDEPAFLNTAWTVQIARASGLACFCVLIAWPVSIFYGDERLRWVLPLIALSHLVSGFNSTSLATLQRRMKVRRLVEVEVGTQLLSGTLMIVWAWLRPGVWALIAGTLASAIVRMAWSHFLIPERKNRIAWDAAAGQELFRFGRWIWIASILTFLASQIDRLILGKLLTLQMLGIYSIAMAISEVPRGLALAINSNVIYPAYSKFAQLPRADFRGKIVGNRWPLLVVMACAVTALTAGGDAAMLFLYDRRYAAGAWMLPLLALGIWPSTLAHTIDSSLFAIGRPRYAASANFLKMLFTAIGIPAGFRLMGVPGAVLVVALNDLPYYGRIAYGLQHEGLSCLAQDLKATALLAAMLALALAGRAALGFGLPVHGMF